MNDKGLSFDHFRLALILSHKMKLKDMQERELDE